MSFARSRMTNDRPRLMMNDWRRMRAEWRCNSNCNYDLRSLVLNLTRNLLSAAAKNAGIISAGTEKIKLKFRRSIMIGFVSLRRNCSKIERGCSYISSIRAAQNDEQQIVISGFAACSNIQSRFLPDHRYLPLLHC